MKNVRATGKIKKIWITTLLTILIVGGLGTGIYFAGQANKPVQEPTPSAEFSTVIESVEQLKELLLHPEELDLTCDVELEITEELVVNGKKSVSGSGVLRASISLGNSISIFTVPDGASLSLSGLTLDGNSIADGVTAKRGAELFLDSVTVIYPFQYGAAISGKGQVTNCVVDYAPTAAILAAARSDVRVSGGRFTNSLSLAFYVESNAKLTLEDEVEIDGSSKHGITNRGTLHISSAEIKDCAQYAVVNYGNFTSAYEGDKADGAILVSGSGKGAIYNYDGGVVKARDISATGCGASTFSNSGEMELTNCSVSGTGTNGVYNTASFTGEGLKITGSGNCGVYNMFPGDMSLNNSNILNSTKRGAHNKGGVLSMSGVTISGCGTHGVANTVDDYGNPGRITASGLIVSGCLSNVYNEKPGVSTAIYSSTLHPSRRTNVVVSYGSMSLSDTRILGTQQEKTYCLQIAKGAVCTVSGSGTEITGATSRGVTNHGTLTINGGSIHGNRSHASGGGVFTDGVLYFKGGNVYGNSAASAGGGIAVGYSTTDAQLVGKLYMSGGNVYNNTAVTNGGGVYVSKGTEFGGNMSYCYAELTGGTIKYNKAVSGTGVMFAADGVVGGNIFITGNNDLRIGSGVVLTASELRRHSSGSPMIIAASGAPGTVIIHTVSAGTANTVLNDISSKTLEFETQGNDIIIKDYKPIVAEDFDMTGAAIVEVSDFQQLKAAVEGAKVKTQVVLKKDISMLGTITPPADVMVQIIDDGNNRSLTRDPSMTSGGFFKVDTGAVFSLKSSENERLTLDGNNTNVPVTAGSSALVQNTGGQLNIENVVLTSNMADVASLDKCYGGLLYASGGLSRVIDSTLEKGNANNGGAIYIDGGQVELVDTDVKNCNSSASGGAVRHQGGSLKIEGGSFEDNNSGGPGGAIATDKAVLLNIKDTVFDGNSTGKGHGGAIYITGGSTLNGENVKFSGNFADGNGSYYGGALALNSASKANLTDCVFDGNKVDHSGTNNGGAVYVGGGSVLEVSGESKFVNNKAATNGGAVYGNAGSQVKLHAGTVFENNTANAGGAIYIVQYSVFAEQCKFNNNKASGASGGAVYISGASNAPAEFKAENCSFTGNNAKTYGGAMNVTSAFSTVTLDGCSFSDNTAAAANNANTLMLSTNANATFADSTITGTGAQVRFHAKNVLYLEGKSVTGTIFYNDENSVISIGATLSEGSAVTIIPKTYTEGLLVASGEGVENSLPFISVAPDSGGGTWSVDSSGKLKDESVIISVDGVKYKTISEAEAAMTEDSVIILLKDISLDTVLTLPEGAVLNGGGFTLSGTVATAGSATLKNISLTNAISVAAGKTLTLEEGVSLSEISLGSGATVALAAALGDDAQVTLSFDAAPGIGDQILVGDEALIRTEYGKFSLGAYTNTMVLGDDGKVKEAVFFAMIGELKYDTLAAAIEAAEDQGGAVITISANTTVPQTLTISSNIVIEGADAIPSRLTRGDTSGPIFNVAGTGSLTLNNVTIEAGAGSAPAVDNNGSFTLGASSAIQNADTTAENSASALLNSGVAVISGRISGNTGASSAVLNNDGATLTITDGAVLSSNRSSATSAAAAGGALVNNGSLTVGAAVFSENKAANGGAINFNGGTASLTGTTFTKNESTSHGGAVRVTSAGGTSMTGVSFTENKTTGATAHGGAIHVASGTLKVTNGVFSNNSSTGNGGAIYSSADLILENCQFSENTAAGTGGGAIGSSNSTTIVGGSFTNNKAISTTTSYGGGAIYGTGNSANFNITGASFSGNESAKLGGAICMNKGTMTMTGGSISSNSSTGNGGAINNAAGTVTLTSVTISGNNSSAGSGAIATTGQLNLTGCTVTGNSCKNAGGAINFQTFTGSSTLSACTFSGNSSSNGVGGALQLSSGVNVNISGGSYTGNTDKNGDCDINVGTATLSLTNEPVIGTLKKTANSTINGSYTESDAPAPAPAPAPAGGAAPEAPAGEAAPEVNPESPAPEAGTAPASGAAPEAPAGEAAPEVNPEAPAPEVEQP